MRAVLLSVLILTLVVAMPALAQQKMKSAAIVTPVTQDPTSIYVGQGGSWGFEPCVTGNLNPAAYAIGTVPTRRAEAKHEPCDDRRVRRVGGRGALVVAAPEHRQRPPETPSLRTFRCQRPPL